MGWDYKQRIVRDAKICGGAPVVRGTRVTIRTILASLAEGETAQAAIRQALRGVRSAGEFEFSTKTLRFHDEWSGR